MIIFYYDKQLFDLYNLLKNKILIRFFIHKYKILNNHQIGLEKEK